jgi:Electron transfer DM13
MRRAAWTAAAVVTILGVAFGAYWFQPWKLWTDDRVDDALPAVATAPAPSVAPPASSASANGPRTSAAAPQAVLLARGSFVSHEHATRGTASIVRQPDGHRVLALADLHTSEGPVVKVWLTDRPVTKKGWHSFDDGRYVDLGGLKGNLGNQLYRIPDGADLTGLRSVTIWCDRFDVSFGAAELVPVVP